MMSIYDHTEAAAKVRAKRAERKAAGTRILKSKYYLCTKEEKGYRVRLDIGPFDTESKAFGHMYQPHATDRHAPMERKPEFAETTTITAKGDWILRRPKTYHYSIPEDTSERTSPD